MIGNHLISKNFKNNICWIFKKSFTCFESSILKWPVTDASIIEKRFTPADIEASNERISFVSFWDEKLNWSKKFTCSQKILFVLKRFTCLWMRLNKSFLIVLDVIWAPETHPTEVSILICRIQTAYHCSLPIQWQF